MSITLTHSGLPAGVKPFELLDMLAKLRTELGLRDEDLAYLRCIFRLARAEDFQPGRICAVWERVAGLADRMNFHIRRITRIETRLEERGLVLRTSAANGRRFGRRREDGRIVSAGGINFAPLIERAPELLARLRRTSREAQGLKEDRNRLNDLIRQIRGLDAPEALSAAREAFPRLRPSEVRDADRMTALIDALEVSLIEFSSTSGQTVQTAPSDSSVRPDTKRERKIKTCRPEPEVPISPAQVCLLASDEMAEVIEIYAEAASEGARPSMRTLALAARERAQMLVGISGLDWDAARDRLGELRVLLCLVIADRNTGRRDRFSVRDPAAAFIGLARKTTRGDAAIAALVAELRRYPATVIPSLLLQRRLALVLQRPLRKGFALPSIKAAGMNQKHPAHGPDRKDQPVLSNERIPHRDSLAKYAVAFFRISRSSVTRARSRFSRRISSAWAATSWITFAGRENCFCQV
ncbi:hypothetical protein NHU_01536 [Rhodovulum sulfidophilum]|uniref:Plasmid replication protein C N-terminal domain-containing protein n=1 Tax=Rhodovulum sulfidophilum TaxID=35806 RepID=A0A0D6B1X9_RHOSU|nr:hypothetical protein NHU_01536 [Rhodovulum sulfidophilum]